MYDRNDISQLALKDRVEVCAALHGCEAVAVGKLGEYADVAVALKLQTW